MSHFTARITLDITYDNEVERDAVLSALRGQVESAIQAGLLDAGGEKQVIRHELLVEDQQKPEHVVVHHWDAEHYDGSRKSGPGFTTRVEDVRRRTGQIALEVAAVDAPAGEGKEFGFIFEINSFHNDEAHYPCLHVSNDQEGNAVLSLFRTKDSVVLRLEPDITTTQITLPDGTPALELK